MSTQIFSIFKFSGAFIALFATAEYLYHQLRFKVEVTRKVVHIGGGLIALTFPLFFKESGPVLFLCLSFLALLMISKPLGLLPSVNAIDRESRGSYLFPIAVAISFYIAALLRLPTLYYLPLSILAISDPMACLAGKKIPFGRYQTAYGHKTLSGSLAFFITAFLISFGFLNYAQAFLQISILQASFLMAFTTMIAEGITGKGYDNITIPLTATLVLYFIS